MVILNQSVFVMYFTSINQNGNADINNFMNILDYQCCVIVWNLYRIHFIDSNYWDIYHNWDGIRIAENININVIARLYAL